VRTIIFYLDTRILPASQYYIQPKDGEYTCYRKATLEFIGMNKVSELLSIESALSTTELGGLKDYGNIDSLQVI